MEKVSSIYDTGGFLERWGEMVENADPEYGTRLFNVLENSELIPENLNGFVFLSVSSNSGSRELGFAEKLNTRAKGNEYDTKPMVIAGDIAEVNPIDSSRLNNINFNHLRADARSIPLKGGSVDILFDRMGAVWYELDKVNTGATRLNGKILDWELEDAVQDMKKLLDEYSRVLKKQGKIIIDFPERIDENATSTGQYIEEVFGNAASFFSELGWELSYVGEGEERLGVLTKES